MKNNNSRRLSTLALAVAAATGLVSASALAVQSIEPVSDTIKVIQKSANKNTDKAALRQAMAKREHVTRYIVEFEHAPAATYRGGIGNFVATAAKASGKQRLDVNSAAVRDYSQFLLAQQKQVLDTISRVMPGVEAERQLTLTFNGAVIKHQGRGVSAEDFKRRLKSVPGVKAVYEDELYFVNMDVSNDLINAPEAWQLLGGQENAGKGVKVAVIDTGIDFEHPMFSDNGHDAPSLGVTDDYCASVPADCNDKLVVARYFPAPSSVHPDEFLDSPRDFNGHGSHVAGTSVGNPVSVNYDGVALNFSGVAPGANLMVYKALWMTADGRGSGLTSSLATALETAAADGADVINNSWGGGAGSSPSSSPYTAIMKSLDEMGVVTVTSAGNSGPGAKTVGCPGCIEETITVASTQTGRQFVSEFDVAGLGSFNSLIGNGDFSLTAPITADLLPAIEVDETNVEACNAFAAGAFSGKIALVTRGTCSFEQKANVLQDAGAVGMVLYNNTAGTISMSMGAATLPGISILQADGLAIEAAWVEGMQATINPKVAEIVPENVDIMSDFSSRGPNGDPNMLKPEIAAPGHDILSAAPGQGYTTMSGTSMAGPHVAGAAALVLAHNPNLVPQQVKSILMTSAKGGVKKEDGATPADAFDVGAGRLEMPTALNTAITFDKASFASPLCVGTCDFDRTITSLVDEATEWRTSFTFADANMDMVVAETISVDANGTAELNVEIDGRFANEGWNFGTLTLTNTSGSYADVNLPIAVYTAISTDSGALVGGISSGVMTAGEAMVATMMASLGDVSGADVTLTAQFPTDDSFVLDADSITLTETQTTTTTSELDEETRTYTWTGTQTNVAATVNVEDVTATAGLLAGLSSDFLAGAGIPVYDICRGEVCDEAALTFPLDQINPAYYWTFGGVDYTTLVMWENGVVEVGGNRAPYTFMAQEMPNTAEPNGIVAPFWQDFQTFASGGELRYAIFNLSGEPHILMEWYNVRDWNNEAGPSYTFNVIFKMGTDEVYVNLLDVNQGDAPDGGNGAYIGMESLDGLEGGSILFSNANLPADGTAFALSYVPGTAASLQVDMDVQVTDFGDVGAATSAASHSQTVTVDLTNAVGKPERNFATLMSVESATASAEALLPVRIKPSGALTAEVVTEPENGTVSFDGLVATYLPEAGYVGEDSFSYRVVDADGAFSATNTVTVTMTNEAPVVAISGPTTADAGDTVELDASTSTDADGDNLTFAWTVESGAEVTLTDANKAVTSFTVPELTEDTTTTFKVTVSDGATSTSKTVNVVLTAVEEEPEPEPTPPPTGVSPPPEERKSSSSFGWLLVMFGLPLVWLRRRLA